MKKTLLASVIALVGTATAASAFSAQPYMDWIEANSNLTCTTQVELHWVTTGQLRQMSPVAQLGLSRDGHIYVVADKQSDRKKRVPIQVHEIVHQCQRDSGVLEYASVDGCLASETQAHELDEKWRKQHGQKFTPVTATRLLEKCLLK